MRGTINNNHKYLKCARLWMAIAIIHLLTLLPDYARVTILFYYWTIIMFWKLHKKTIWRLDLFLDSWMDIKSIMAHDRKYVKSCKQLRFHTKSREKIKCHFHYARTQCRLQKIIFWYNTFCTYVVILPDYEVGVCTDIQFFLYRRPK